MRSAYANGFDPEGKLSDKDRLEKLSKVKLDPYIYIHELNNFLLKLLRIWRDKAIYSGPVIDEMEEVVKGNKSAMSSGPTQSSAASSHATGSSHSYQQQSHGQQSGYGGQSYNNQPPPPDASHYGGGGFHAVVSIL